MKRLLVFLTVILAGLFFLTGCVKDNWGWPREVVFEKEGGEKTIGTTHEGEHALSLFISDDTKEQTVYLDFFPLDYGEEASLQYEWLTVTVTKAYESMKLTVEPNTTGKPRTLWVYGHVFDWRFHVQIKQDG